MICYFFLSADYACIVWVLESGYFILKFVKLIFFCVKLMWHMPFARNCFLKVKIKAGRQHMPILL